LVVSDDADELARLCDRLLVMSRGEIVQEIAASEIGRLRRSEISLAN
jgi:ABC-type sugar transport system ATPase subunit